MEFRGILRNKNIDLNNKIIMVNNQIEIHRRNSQILSKINKQHNV